MGWYTNVTLYGLCGLLWVLFVLALLAHWAMLRTPGPDEWGRADKEVVVRRVRLGNWTFRWDWCSPGGYCLRYWLLQWGFYPGLTYYVRVAGFLVQAWDVRKVVRSNREEWRVTC